MSFIRNSLMGGVFATVALVTAVPEERVSAKSNHEELAVGSLQHREVKVVDFNPVAGDVIAQLEHKIDKTKLPVMVFVGSREMLNAKYQDGKIVPDTAAEKAGYVSTRIVTPQNEDDNWSTLNKFMHNTGTGYHGTVIVIDASRSEPARRTANQLAEKHGHSEPFLIFYAGDRRSPSFVSKAGDLKSPKMRAAMGREPADYAEAFKIAAQDKTFSSSIRVMPTGSKLREKVEEYARKWRNYLRGQSAADVEAEVVENLYDTHIRTMYVYDERLVIHYDSGEKGNLTPQEIMDKIKETGVRARLLVVPMADPVYSKVMGEEREGRTAPFEVYASNGKMSELNSTFSVTELERALVGVTGESSSPSPPPY
jgi:hypothetical protein